MSKTIAYLRVSTDSQDLKNQKLEILEYADQNKIQITQWMEIKISSRNSTKKRLIDQLLELDIRYKNRWTVNFLGVGFIFGHLELRVE